MVSYPYVLRIAFAIPTENQLLPQLGPIKNTSHPSYSRYSILHGHSAAAYRSGYDP